MEESRSFACFGGSVTVLVGGRSSAGADPAAGLDAAQQELLDIHAALTRFDPASELCRLNADARAAVPASPVMLAFAAAVARAGTLSGGLVDATLLGELETAGYVGSRAGAPGFERTPVATAVAPAAPGRHAAWRDVRAADGLVHRPPGVRLDSGGLGKGLAADLVIDLLSGYPTACVVCGGDIRVGGTSGAPRRINVLDGASDVVLHNYDIAAGGIATSGIATRSWVDAAGRDAHHLIDPQTGRPAFTGVLQATALAPTALEAEVRSKAALLAGPDGAPAHLLFGGFLLLADGSTREVPAADI